VKVKFNGTNKNEFYSDVKNQVNDYFRTNNLSKNANGEMIAKTVFFLGSFVGLYILIVFGDFSLLVKLLMTVLFGMVQAFVGFNVGHDAIHGSYSTNKTLNKILGFSYNMIGANAYVWSITHNVVHHTFTNIPGHDEDLDVAPGLIRLSPMEEKKPFMRFQHLYAFLLYGLASLSWVFRKDYIKFFKKKIGQTDNTKHPKIEYFNLFFFKILYYFLFIILPLVVMDITWWQYIIGFLIMHLSKGFVLGLIFQLAHVVEGTSFPLVNETNSIEESWAIHQMQTTANFSTKSPIAKFFCGGLNFQIEHHLFPQICHVHYPVISKIVQETAQRHNVPYHNNESFVGALKSHYRTLKYLGNQ
jgi:linoleoyl-CoA desaturase